MIEPIKTPVRAVRVFSQYVVIGFAALILLITAVFYVIHSSDRKNQAELASTLVIEGVHWSAIHSLQDLALVTPQLELYSGMLTSMRISFQSKEQLIVFKASPQIAGIETFTKAFQVQNGAYISFSYTQITQAFIVNSIASMFCVLVLFGISLIALVRFVERKLYQLERKARKLGVAKRRAERIKYRSFLGLLDSLLDELAESRSYQHNVDRFIRGQTFLDPELGIGNRMFFDHRLDAALNETSAGVGGAVLLIHLQDLDLIESKLEQSVILDVLRQYIDVLSNVFTLTPEPLLARRAEAELALLIPSIAEVDLIKQTEIVMRSLNKVDLPEFINRETFFHIGIARFAGNERAYQVLSEADMALRTAQLQGHFGWFMYENDDRPKDVVMGSLKWRTFLEKAIHQESFLLHFQPIFSATGENIHHQEAEIKVRDDEGKLLPSNVFLPMARKCGMQSIIEKQALIKLSELFAQEVTTESSSSINICIDSLLDNEFQTWLVSFLQDNVDLCERLIIELHEYHLKQHSADLESILHKLNKLGVRLLVDQVGQYVINSNYLRYHAIAYIKLHASIIRNVDQIKENQIFIKSLQANCRSSHIRMFACGVATEREWKQLASLQVDGGQGPYFASTINNIISH